MDRLTQRIGLAKRALDLFDELAGKSTLTVVERDAAIQRFEYSFEAVWKAVQLHLREVEGLEVGSPKGAIRASLQTGVLDVAQTRDALAMADDRNLSVHTYNERLAQELAGRLGAHAALLRLWVEQIAASTTPGAGA